MSSLPREDVKLPHGGVFTFKQMPNGEERRRLVTPSGGRMSETVGPNWKPVSGELPWQDNHYHCGLTEHYIVRHGWAVFLFIENKEKKWRRLEAGGHIFFEPMIPHVVLMGPEAVIATVLVGTPIGNPDRNGEDWWPTMGELNVSLEFGKMDIEEQFL